MKENAFNMEYDTSILSKTRIFNNIGFEKGSPRKEIKREVMTEGLSSIIY
jgi:hypothetical protein